MSHVFEEMTTIDIHSLSNNFSFGDSKTIQDYIKTFNAENAGTQNLSNDNFVYDNSTSIALDNFVTAFPSIDLNDDLSYQIVNNSNSGFNVYENSLDKQDICLNESYGTNEIGYDANCGSVSYFDLDASQSNMDFNEIDLIPESYEEIFQSSLAFINQPKEIVQTKKSNKKQEKIKRGRGRPKSDLAIIKKKVAKAEETKDKDKIRTERNNQASKEYRDRKSDKKKQLDIQLAVENEKYQQLKKIHTKLTLRIKHLEDMIRNHTFF